MDRYNISFTGAGKVGSALCRALFNAGHKINVVVSETPSRGLSLAEDCGANWSSEPQFPQETEVIIVSVPDQQLVTILKNIRCRPGTLIAHTAGSYGLEVFPGNVQNKGVLYPLQTFTTGRKIDFPEIPILIEAPNNYCSNILNNIADSLGSAKFPSNTEQRILVHLAAVFACNFTNHLLTESKEIMKKSGFAFDILKPLIAETISKAIMLEPENSQTGPAIRGDKDTIDKHLALLEYSPGLQKVYGEITELIINFYKKDQSGQF